MSGGERVPPAFLIPAPDCNLWKSQGRFARHNGKEPTPGCVVVRPVGSIAFLLVVPLLAGCIQDGPQGAGGTAPIEQKPGRGGGDNEATPNVALQGILQLDGCTWLHTDYRYPAGTNPTPVPPGWGTGDSKPTSFNVLHLYECDFVSLDGLDRPANLLLETSNAGSAPEGCLDSDYATWFLANLFTDDEALAGLLATRYHAPVRLAEFSRDTRDEGIVWEWSRDGKSSELTYPAENVVEDSNYYISPRHIIWTTPSGTNTLQVEFHATGPDYISRAVAGALSDDHYMGVQGQFAGAAGFGPEMTITAPILTRGPLCEPLEPQS